MLLQQSTPFSCLCCYVTLITWIINTEVSVQTLNCSLPCRLPSYPQTINGALNFWTQRFLVSTLSWRVVLCGSVLHPSLFTQLNCGLSLTPTPAAADCNYSVKVTKRNFVLLNFLHDFRKLFSSIISIQTNKYQIMVCKHSWGSTTVTCFRQQWRLRCEVVDKRALDGRGRGVHTPPPIHTEWDTYFSSNEFTENIMN